MDLDVSLDVRAHFAQRDRGGRRLYAQLLHLHRHRERPHRYAHHQRARSRRRRSQKARAVPHLIREESRIYARRICDQDRGRLAFGGDRAHISPLRKGAAREQRSRLRRPLAQDVDAVQGASRRVGEICRTLPLHPRRRVSRHQQDTIFARAHAGEQARQRVRRRRRRSEHLRLARRGGGQHRRLQKAQSRLQTLQTRAQLSLHAQHPRPRQQGHRQQLRTPRQDALDGGRQGQRGRLPQSLRRQTGGGLCHRRDPQPAQRRLSAQRHRHSRARQLDHQDVRGQIDALQSAVPLDRRHEVLRQGGGQGLPRLPQMHRESARRRKSQTHHQRPQPQDRRSDRRQAGTRVFGARHDHA